jgi:hypothetical protein
MRARLVYKRAHLVLSAPSSQLNHSIARAAHALVAFSLPPPLRLEPARGEPRVRERVELRLLRGGQPGDGGRDQCRGVGGRCAWGSMSWGRAAPWRSSGACAGSISDRASYLRRDQRPSSTHAADLVLERSKFIVAVTVLPSRHEPHSKAT